MRLNRLDLTRYGKFTDQSLDFGVAPTQAPDLHIVYGPNESGKSTALAGYLDLLFGIEPRSRYNFRHPYPTMRLGGALELASGVREFGRLKRPQNSLLDVGGQPIADGVILGDLGGIDREAYRQMFSLDDETLEAGGESILASKGDLGQLLFSASAGLADLSRALGDLRAEADGFYRKSARSGTLSDLKARLVDLKTERDRIDTFASQYAQLVEERDRTRLQYEAALATRGRTQARIDEVQRLLSALPRLATLRELRGRLEPFSDIADAPADWREALPALEREEIELSVHIQSLDEDIDRLASELEALVIDPNALAAAERLDGLSGLRARYVTAAEDLPDRRRSLDESAASIAALIDKLGQPAETPPALLLIDAPQIGILRELIEAHSGVLAATHSARSARTRAERRLEEATATLEAAGGADEDGRRASPRTASIAPALAQARASDHDARRRLALRARASHQDALAERLSDLRPWVGPADDLMAMTIPPASQLERWRSAADQLASVNDTRARDIERLTSERIRLAAEISGIETSAGVVSDNEAAQVRNAREEAWAGHRQTLDAQSADAFERALRRDDAVSGARSQHFTDLAKLNHATQTLAVTEADIARAGELQCEAAAALTILRQEIDSAIVAIAPSLPRGMDVGALEAWLARRVRALETRTAIQTAERDVQDAEADALSVRTRLAAALTSNGIAYEADANVDTLILQAEAAVTREAEVRGLITAVADRRRDLKNCQDDVARAEAAEREWNDRWEAACSTCWLGGGKAAPSLAAVRESLVLLMDLRAELEKHDGLADRIGKMEQDQADYASAVTSLAEALGRIEPSDDVLGLGRMIDEHTRAAKADEASRAEKVLRLQEAREALRTLSEKRAVNVGRKAEMTGFFSVESFAEVAVKLQDLDRKAELKAQVEAASKDILEAVGATTLEAAEQMLDATERTALEVERAELKIRFDDEDQRGRDLFAHHSKAADQLEAIGGDAAVAKIEEQRRTTRLEIEDGAMRYLRLRAGVAAAEQALRVYRDRHRSSMMMRASQAFQTISRGAYTGLATQTEKDQEILVALDAEGGSKVASDLSKGTRFQLYLALRVAGYHEFARTRKAVPFIADDIMETFDDFRAEEAFRLFMDMAGVGQVIYLTHHAHLCVIAKRICPSAKIHNLG
jgi:uncharacterized protein YhaN